MNSFRPIQCLLFALGVFISFASKSAEFGRVGNSAICDTNLIKSLQQKQSTRQPDVLGNKLNGVENRHTWLDQNFTPEVREALEQRMHLLDFLKNQKLGPGERVVWLQQGSLKELNEKLWNIGGTERFLQLYDQELSALLKEKNLGRRLHTNYKDRVLITALDDVEFGKQVLDPLYDRMAKRLSVEYSGDATKSYAEWKNWLMFSSRRGSGPDLVSAHLAKQGIHSSGDYADAIKHATRLQNSLKEYLARAQIGFEEFYQLLKSHAGRETELRGLLLSRGLKEAQIDNLLSTGRNYREALGIADFLPLPDTTRDSRSALEFLQKQLGGGMVFGNIDNPALSRYVRDTWTAQQAQFLANSVQAGHVIAADIKGVGIQGLRARDEWLRAGADRMKLPAIYQETSRAIDTKVSEVLDGLRKICGGDAHVHVYQSGDDLLIALPKIAEEKLSQVREFLSQVKDLYSNVETIAEPGNTKAISQAISKARESMFDEKIVLK